MTPDDLGLGPRVRQSGSGPAAHGRISKQGSNSDSHALVEAAWSIVRHPGPIAAVHQRVKARRVVAQAGLPVLVSAHARRGLRVRPTVADPQEDAPPRAHGRRRALPRRPRRLVDERGDARRRTRPRPPSTARLRTHDQRPPNSGRERDTGPRISSRAADLKAHVCALTRRRPRPIELFHDRRRSINST